MRIAAGVAGLGLLGGMALAADRLLDPLTLTLPMTSSFGEYRAGHYHGGVDFSTGGEEGLPVLAPAAGWVFRIRASGVGYGKSVYFRLEDGRTVLYAHLSRFHPRVDDTVRDEQDRLSRYEVDLYPEPGALAFGAGDVLGYTGQTGAGPPHLHAEMRVGKDASVAVNPLLRGWSVPDTTPPTLTRLRIEPARAGVLVNGGVDPLVVDLGDPRPVSVSGPVRLWAESSDQADGGAYRLAPYRVSWTVDGAAVTEVRLDAFDWHWPREVEWTFHNALARTRNERWIALQAPARSNQETVRSGSEVAWAPGEQRWVLRAEDAAGNVTQRALSVQVVDAVGIGRAAPAGGNGKGLAIHSRGRFLDVHPGSMSGLEIETVTALAPSGGPIALDSPVPGVFQLGGPRSAEVGVWTIRAGRSDRGGFTARVLRIDPGADTAPLVWEEGGFRLTIPAESGFSPLWVVGEDRGRPEPGVELEPASRERRLEPWATPLRRRGDVAFAVESGDRRGLAVFRRDGDGWAYEGSDTSRVGWVGARITNLESLALFRDRTPPAVEVPVPGPEARPSLVAHVVDGGAGVTWRSVAMNLDGRTLIAEWDPDADRLTAHLRAPLAPGEHVLRVEARDRVGNRAEVVRRFVTR